MAMIDYRISVAIDVLRKGTTIFHYGTNETNIFVFAKVFGGRERYLGEFRRSVYWKFF
jgi:hypothetical protein